VTVIAGSDDPGGGDPGGGDPGDDDDGPPSVGGTQRPISCSVDPEQLEAPGEVTITATIEGAAPPGDPTWTVPLGLFVNGAQIDSANISLSPNGAGTANWDVFLDQNGSYQIQVTSGDPYK
jgi:hypothetical protein